MLEIITTIAEILGVILVVAGIWVILGLGAGLIASGIGIILTSIYLSLDPNATETK